MEKHQKIMAVMGKVYKSLEDIPLARFIDVFLGDSGKAVKEGTVGKQEAKRAARKLCGEYVSIVGGKSALAQLGRRDGMLRVQMRLACLDACRRLALLDDWDGVRGVLRALGYEFRPGERERMRRKLDSVEASDRYKLERMRASAATDGGVKMDREYFTRERVAVMGHVKMYIDPEVFTASEYAWMVRRMCDELEAAMKKAKK